MKYELAKKLKDAGFPQKSTSGYHPGDTAFDIDSKYRVYEPILSELIEACGSPFQLNSLPTGNVNDDTEGRMYYVALSPIFKGAAGAKYPCPFGEGTSYEEAVANLWIALNTLSHS